MNVNGILKSFYLVLAAVSFGLAFVILSSLFTIGEVLFALDFIDRGELWRVYAVLLIDAAILVVVGCLEVFSWSRARYKEHHANLLLVSIFWLFGGSASVLLFVIAGLFLNDPLLDLFFAVFGEVVLRYVSRAALLLILICVELFLLFDTVRGLVCAVGLATKNERVWRFTVRYHFFYSWTVVDYLIARFISTRSVRRVIAQGKK